MFVRKSRRTSRSFFWGGQPLETNKQTNARTRRVLGAALLRSGPHFGKGHRNLPSQSDSGDSGHGNGTRQNGAVGFTCWFPFYLLSQPKRGFPLNKMHRLLSQPKKGYPKKENDASICLVRGLGLLVESSSR